MISIFTPAYNRAYILENLYYSLKTQTSYDFEWIIADDGSTDGTEGLICSWMQETKLFPIRYKKFAHGGKHRAINAGAAMAEYEAFFIVDSDDFLTEDAVHFINTEFEKIKDKEQYAGISGLRCFVDGNVIGGKPAFENFVDATNFERERYGLLGDKAEVYKTSVLRKYPFPEFDGETFLTEAVVWDAIAFAGLKIRWFNKPIYYTEYLPDGLSKNYYQKMKENPHGYAEWIRRERNYGNMKRDELEYLMYQYVERSEQTGDQICEILDIEEEECSRLLKIKSRIVEKKKNEIQSHEIKNMALY